ncbi:MAG: threonine--tRNA ligase [bacterium]
MKEEILRHSLSHILAHAIKELYPGVKFGIGPAIENGFYYDFEFKNNISIQDLPKIEKKMKELIKQNFVFNKKNITKTEARKLFKDQPYKLDLIAELPGKTATIYESGTFVDLCKGPHLKSTKEINPDAFELEKTAGAYWKGSEKNQMLTRIYGLAFSTKKELDSYIKLQEEAEKRDHRILGQTMDLFHIDENVGPGLILWHPKGASLKKAIMDRIIEECLKDGYQLVETPHIAKLNLWRISGHSDFYKENMMPPMRMKDLDKREKDDYQIKPMNCPFHIAIYKTELRSYKNLPIRFAEMGTVYRYEKSGTLHGLIRVRGFTQDDAHIFCSEEQLAEELAKTIKLTNKILRIFGFEEFDIYLSTKPDKYVGKPRMWEKAETALKYALEKSNMKYQIDAGGGAFYGPKIDIKIKDSIGRLWQCTTIQVDFNLPERFDINYINQNGKKQRPILIHRAILGSLERFIGILLEHHGEILSKWPAWLAPIQLGLAPKEKQHKDLAKYIYETLKTQIRMKNFEDEIKIDELFELKNIRMIAEAKINFEKKHFHHLNTPYFFIIGDRELKEKKITIGNKIFENEDQINNNKDPIFSPEEKRIFKLYLEAIKNYKK